MHVVIDARYVSRLQSGVGHYTQRLVGGLAAIDRRNRYTCLVAEDAPDLPIPEPAASLPLVKLGSRPVVTIHDLVSFLFPRTVPRKYALYMRLMTRLAVRSADRIIAGPGGTPGGRPPGPPAPGAQ